MTGVIKNVCWRESCHLRLEFGYRGQLYPVSCRKHASSEMVHFTDEHNRCSVPASEPEIHVFNLKMDLRKTKCEKCSAWATFNYKGASSPRYCRYHASKNMVDVRVKRCVFNDCLEQPSFDFPWRNEAQYCRKHSISGMVNVKTRHCAHASCQNIPSCNFFGRTYAMYCDNHRLPGMINIHNPTAHDEAAMALVFLE